MSVITLHVSFNPLVIISAGISTDKSPPDSVVDMMSEIRALQEIIAKFKAMQVDATEYACLKGIVIFKTGTELYRECLGFLIK